MGNVEIMKKWTGYIFFMKEGKTEKNVLSLIKGRAMYSLSAMRKQQKRLSQSNQQSLWHC